MVFLDKMGRTTVRSDHLQRYRHTSQTTKTVIKQSVLITGSSILKGVRNNGLKANATVRTFPGATIESLTSRLEHYDIDNCKTIILHVGGNDADNGVDLDTFVDNYTTLLSQLNSDDRTIIVSGLLPRGSVDLEPYNDRLRTLCLENDIDFVDHFDGFLLASGELPASYYMKDKTHLNATGTRKLLQSIDQTCKITRSPGEIKYTYTCAILKAYKVGHYGPKIVWMFPGWFTEKWWRDPNNEVTCTE